MSETSSLPTPSPENAQRVPSADERESQMKFYVMEWWRLRHLIDTADLSSIGLRQFRMICRLLRGSAFTEIIDGRKLLINALAKAIEEHKLFREAIADKQFVNLPFDSAKDFFRHLETERAMLEEVADAVVKLDAAAVMALVRHVEHTSNAADDDFEDSCDKGYSSIQSLRHLYADIYPSRGHFRGKR